MNDTMMRAVMALPSLVLCGCAVTSQLHSELDYGGASDGMPALYEAGIGVLTPAAPTGQESDKQALGESLSAAFESELGDARVLALPAMLSAINRAGLASRYARALADYENTGILDRDTLHEIGNASGVRYLAKLNLGNFDQSSDKRLAIAGIRLFDTWRATIRVHLEVWDSHTGEIAWQGNDELVYAREGVKERPVTLRQVADVAARSLVEKVGTSGSEKLDQDPETLATR